MVPVLALVVVLLVAGGTFVFMKTQAGDQTPVAATSSGSAAPSATTSAAANAGANADVCGMLDPVETERLVPQAKIDSRTSDNRADTIVSYVRWTCTWANRNISYRDVTRSREIVVNVARYEALGETTAEKAAKIQFNGELSQYTYGGNNSTKERYYSKPTKFTGVGEEAVAQYQLVREKDYHYSFGQGMGRVGNITFQVKYEASQQHKEADLFSAETKQSITEENAIREVKVLLEQLAQSVTAWQQGKPSPFAGKARPSPTPTASPKPVLIDLPPHCVALNQVAAELVPQTKGEAATSKDGKAEHIQCQWWNDKMPVADGKIRWRNLMVSVREFPDADSARFFLIDKRGKTKFTASSRIGGIAWSKITKLPGIGEDNYGQAIKQKTDTAYSARYEIYALQGTRVVYILFGGSDRPANTPINSPDSTLMDLREALNGAKTTITTVLKAL
ncbi:hypothetical protein GCM10009555_077600 [Acrocarpospora macrocephala]|uniref:DUF3558 domain-containing protein n=1 Tax=Acrocarpospora macrocephala TaxID=150177 RepID=A0A5M3X5P3_9ACTN|nr:hypothetical protein [Acrocarpospora macrocephala]GES15966.1 hypothetical protein Amac_095640 [Acrocarpospora macrocephala]